MKLGSAADGLVGSDLEFPAFDPLVRRVLWTCWDGSGCGQFG